MLCIAYCRADSFIIILRFYQILQIINNDTTFNIADTKIKCNAVVPISIVFV